MILTHAALVLVECEYVGLHNVVIKMKDVGLGAQPGTVKQHFPFHH